MNSTTPRYLLFSEARRRDNWLDKKTDFPFDRSADQRTGGQWRFVLESLDGPTVMDVADDEATYDTDRLELLAVVRGLEALEQPSRVTLVTSSRSVSRGLRSGLEQWREADWQWERFGHRVPITNGDLWRRVDRAMQFHQVDCRTWRADCSASLSTENVPFATALEKVESVHREPDFRTGSLSLVRRWTSRWKTRLGSFLALSMCVFRQPSRRRSQVA